MAELWPSLSRRVVMVARWDERDGIAKYADELIARCGGERTFVRVGILDGPGDYHRRFERGPRALWLLRDARRGDDVVVQYHPHYYLSGGALARSLSHLSWGLLGLLRRTTFVVHEFDRPPANRLEAAAQGWGWRRAGRLVFPSEWQRDRHRARFGRGRGQQVLVLPHVELFRVDGATSRDEARALLGLPRERTLLLMLGFISAVGPDKAYDRALAALAAAAPEETDLRIVGSPIRQDATTAALVEHLREVAGTQPNVFLHEAFVDDREFDLWLRAADALVAPYRTGSSSGVVARARLLGTRVVTSGVAGLAEQVGPEDFLVSTDEELAAALARVARESAYERRASSSR